MNDAQRRVVVVVVTGAGTGIGRATARAFSVDGAHVLAVGRRAAPLAETAAGHPLITPLTADVTAPDAPDRVVGAALHRYGRLDVLVNNAGIAGGGPLAELDEAAARRQLDTNLLAPVRLARATVAALADTRGVIVNVTTSVGQRAWPGSSVYAAGKAALDSLTRSWAVELAPRGIRVVAVAPGAIDTPIGAHQGLSPEQRAAVRRWQLAHTPLGRIGGPQDVAWAIRQLCDPAAGFVTGVVLPVDGGAVVG
ncbi:SDR family NAD(P)-dependent oxidoreductase [Micromonospora sp. NPDC093277]|uniref:SDR family NAD(P)-dependent oxidoreductase n=1 Tax=Micromonospora sp. NPDC093277 TaxID=3364291 RepID=UPI0038101C21